MLMSPDSNLHSCVENLEAGCAQTSCIVDLKGLNGWPSAHVGASVGDQFLWNLLSIFTMTINIIALDFFFFSCG